MVSVRYVVDAVDAAVAFYTERLGFEVQMHPAEVERHRAAGAAFRSDIVTGVGGRQILLDDPSGNLVELFEPGS